MPVVKMKSSVVPEEGKLSPKTRTKTTASDLAIAKLTLPEGPEEPVSSLAECTFLIYGEKKIGKTSMCAQFDDPIFLMFEPGGKGLRITRRQVSSWAEFVKYVDLIVKSDQFKTVIIDPIDLCYKACVDWVCAKHGVDDPREVGWGEGWKAIEEEFRRQITKVASTSRGVVFLSHIENAEFQRRNDIPYHKMVPTMMKQARSFISGFVDVIGYYGYYGTVRYLTIEGSDEIEGGNRLKYRFRTTSGEKVHSIPMGDSEEEAYANFVAAFNNEQEDRYEPDDTATLSEAPVKRKDKKKGA